MLTADDKKWISAEITAQIATSEERVGARMEKIETVLLTEFHSRTLAVSCDSFGCAAAHPRV